MAKISRNKNGKSTMNGEVVTVTRALDGRITSWGQGAQRAFGYTAEETVGKHVSLIIPFDWQDEEYQLIDRLRAGEPVEDIRTVRRTRDGYLLDLTMNVQLVHDPAGQVTGVRKIYKQISPRERLAQPMFERLGGREAISDAVNRLTARLLADTRLAAYFAGLPADDAKQMQSDFLSVAMGGPRTLRDDRRSEHLTLTEEHFAIVASHLTGVLREVSVTPALITEAMETLSASRRQALGGG